ncbi:bifunctional proline dehydrogenase/L-glutamate gamma-semialdehyde dehydrogenase [Aeromicrobium duanguangcaii]|uniref:L-glutamate gamma-semialdehyde dehydrogenase n=1 Tax=Aeromicrobium duanguangcaii TaxID=2968086 RepID=A0ABY5KC18_9ACTN|nr:bifunctional proline dehydrogenase/L-glutamate gamma-semialdehyde dehydrogenase [Aeromicrobium duanguangcaii]MCD9154757.1 bifunctional proline dehydrogenase/L-glutamate gamma-semialdehyde dehydrogenase [Aeromicrobium duanguangcaii]UUI67829.1 bifunctional proline dehydrogenase/L-glutamate gamma-semialdehyde dehydrogenase [Aeromicrobium duanguangcaii]
MIDDVTQPPDPFAPDPLAQESVELVRRWLAESAEVPADKAGAQLAGLLKDPKGLDFTVGFIDGVIRPEDPRIAARNFAVLASDVPAFLPWYLRNAVRLGALAGRFVPRLVIPIVQRALRSLVGHLIVDATDAKLGRSIAKIRRDDVRLNINLLGEAVLGEREAARRLKGTHDLLARADVDYVSIKVSATVPPHSPWAFDEAVEHVAENLMPLYRQAAEAPSPKFINLDMEEYHDLDLTIAVFTKILDTPGLEHLEAGIVLQAYLPDSMRAMIHLQEWSAARRARGGAGIKVRVVKGANLPMERVDAAVHGWPLATWSSKQESDTNYKRVLDYAMHPERIENVRIGVAGHNLFDLAHAWLLAGQRGVRDGVEIEMLLGMAQSQAEVVRRDVGGLLLYTPVVHPKDFDVAIAYLIRRLEEGASHDNFMSAVFELNENHDLFEREKNRFLASLAALDDSVPAPNRTQDRSAPVQEPPAGAPFENTPDTDPSLPANRAWGRRILARVAGSALGEDLVKEHTLTDADTLESVVASAVVAGEAWGRRPAAERAEILERAALRLEERRADLLEVMASEAGKPLDQGDPEVSEAIDFARYYAHLARGLDDVDGATFVPSRLTVVTPPWNFPVAIPAGSTLAALAAGSAVVIKPAPQAARCGSVMVEALWEAGVPREVLRLVHVEESDLGRRLVSDPRVDRLILTGAYETAELFRSFRPDLPLLAETSGKNAIVVTPSADFDLAAKDIAASGFGHAGQKCSASSLVILVGSVATSKRFREQLVDAVTSLTVGWPSDPQTQMGPLIEPASGKLLRGLTTLDAGESWLVKPRQLDEAGQLWSPGIRTGVKRGSTTHLTEYFGPVMGIMTAETLEEALEIQNQVDYGLTAGLHALDSAEIAVWLDGVQAGNLYVNRGTTGAIVRRQPFGGWKKSAIGAGTKAGGPHYLFGLGEWAPARSTADASIDPRAERLLQAAREAHVPTDEVGFLERSFRSDAAAWREEFGTARDVSAIFAERNILRYVPTRVHIRLAADATLSEGLRVIGAGLTSGAPLQVSSAFEVPDAVRATLRAFGVSVMVEDDATWAAVASCLTDGRVRLVGGSRSTVAQQTGGKPDLAIWAHRPTEAGQVELLPFVHEQAVSITAHRFGTPNHLTDDLI